jgi:arylsulfatase A-like enzyme
LTDLTRGRRTWNAAAAGVVAGAAGGLLLAAVEIAAHRFVQHGTWMLAVQTGLRLVERSVILAVLVVLGLAAAFALTRAILRRPLTTRFERVMSTVVVATILLAGSLYLVNRHWLPHKFAPISLAADAVLTLLLLLLSYRLVRAPWERLLQRLGSPAWRRPALATITAIAVIHGGALVLGATRVPSGPSVVLIVVDTLRADYLGAYGHPRPVSPHVDRLAGDAALYENAISAAPWTAPALASMLTARTPPTLRFLGEHPVPIADRFLTLAEVFRDRGYRTQAIVSHHFVSSVLGFDQGFDRFDESQAQGHGYVSSPTLSDKAVSFLDRHGDEPFLLFLHYFDPHFDFILHEGFEFGPAYEGRRIRSGQPIGELRRLAPDLTPDDVAYLRSLYESEIAFTDAQIGRVLRRLEELGLYEDSLIVFTADHGEEFLERGDDWIGHTRTLYGEVIRVPLIVKRPGPARRDTVSEFFSLTDLMPLIAEHAGVSLPATVEHGDGGAATFDGGRPIVSETLRMARLQSVVDDGLKLIQNLDTGRRRLFDLRRDPGERDDLLGRAPDEVQRLTLLLENYREWTGALIRGERPDEAQFTEEQLEQLRSLGYVD